MHLLQKGEVDPVQCKFWDETGDFFLIMLVEAFLFLWLVGPFKRQIEEKDSLCQALKRPIWNKRKNSEA
jgi:hypothetical protein